MTTVYNPYEDWGYKFTGKAIDSFIRDIEGEATLNKYPEFCARRDRAEQLMFDLFGSTPYLFYVRRIEQGHNLGEQKWELILATDLDNILKFPTKLEDKGSTLKLVSIVNNDGYGGLRIIYARLRPKHEGKKDSFAQSCYIRLRSNYQYGIGVPPEAIKRIIDKPFKKDYVPTDEQLKAWKIFLKVLERLAREKQFCVPFVSHNYGEATRNITFKIDARSATVDSQAEDRIELDAFWQRAKRARNQNIKLKENNLSDSDGRKLGTIESIDSEKNLLKISLDDEIFDSLAEGHYALPQEGLLSFEAVGDLVAIGWQKKAIKALENGWTQNPYLGQFLFDASQAREPKENIQIQPQDLLLKTINPSQKAAVETVLSAPDLALIQGPPGTGKTTVIAEICYQVALRGGRTLIASQANLAVDNALSRLQHNPVIRAVRKGNKNSVGLEGEPFLEDKVIKTWLQNTSADCEQRLNQKLELAKILRQLLASAEHFDTYLITEEKFQPKHKQLVAHQVILEKDYQHKHQAHALAQEKQKEIELLYGNLEAILASSPPVNWDWTTIVNCLTKLTPYTNKDDSVEQLAINVDKVTVLVKEIDLVVPEYNLFVIAGWLQDNLPLKLAEARLVLDRAKDAKTAMVEANSAWQTFQEYSAKDSELKQEQQEISDAIQNRQQQIATLHECLDIVQNTISELNLSIKLHYLQIFRELEPLSVKFADYIRAESTFVSQQKLLQECKATIESEYRVKKEDCKEAEQKEREIKFLKFNLEGLLAKVPNVNWYELEVIDLLARLQPYVDKETSARGSTENVINEIREIAIKFNILPSEYRLLGWVGLYNGISTQLASIQTALSLAQNVALAMSEIDFAAQTLIKNKNLIAQLQAEKSKITQKQTEFQKELNNLNLQKSKLNLASADLQKWSQTAYLKLYEASEQCFQHQQSLTKYSLQLPVSFVEIANSDRANSKPWETCLRFGNNKLSKLITQYHEWKEILVIFRSIDLMIQEGKNLVNVNPQTLSSNTVDEFFNAIAEEINSLNPLQAIKKLQNRTQTTLGQIQKKLGTWNQHWQFINYQQRRGLLRSELRAIAQHCNAIIKQNKLKELESIFKQITDETTNGIFTSSQQFLDKTSEEINHKVRQIQERLNELKNDELGILRQISLAQESVKKSRNEGKYNFSQVLTLLRQMNESPILPESLRSIAKQDLQPSDIRRLAPQFLGQVNYYQNCFDKLEVLIPKLNPFSVLSNVNRLITVALDSCRENNESLDREVKNARHQLDKIDIQLEQNLESLKTQRSQAKTETEELLNQLTEQLTEQTRSETDIHRQILITKEQVKTSKSEAEHKIEQFIELWQEIRESSQLLPQLHTFFNKCFQNPKTGIADSSELSSLVKTHESQIEQIENLIPQLNPFPVLSKIKSKIDIDLQQQQKTTVEAFERLQDSQAQLDEIKTQLQQQTNAIEQERHWWQEYWQTVPKDLRPEEEFADLFELNFLRKFRLQFEIWRQQLGGTEAYLNRYQNLISDWIERLKNPSEQNRHELRRIYLDNANVIGITCSQSARGDFSKEFKSFDVVIIDEVSKCTPPELLIPALKAKKLVLVGDHRQLPPMLNNDTVEEIAEELGTTTEELKYLKQSLFKNLFESAPESIKKMLTIQYRMHPQIMGAINQFYEDNLECGLTNPEEQRAHYLANSYIKNNNHVVWVKTPLNQEFKEIFHSPGYTNPKEIEVIENICQQFEQTWSVKVRQGQPRKEIGIITFYGRQLKLIEDILDFDKFPSLHIRTGTVDRFQGMERQVIIVSMVRNNERKNVGFAKKPERVNVAFSRAQELLVIIGCHSLFTKSTEYSEIAHLANLHGGLIDVSDIFQATN
ncbi:AAA domain-containing protein [Myxosarcina sp. GI1]|uniref:AAA domain-containing protein n=1 Tax=Myxosarcina sp. GI1 TaxID=1541065 RepID=UPI00068DCB2F|nr:AAA domain-containing protein [Myxosarcina sp. GI1]